MDEPVLVGFLFADRIVEEKTNKKVIVGTFNVLGSEKFPVAFPQWFLYAAVTNLIGNHSFSIILYDIDRKGAIFEFTGGFEVKDKDAVIEIVTGITNAQFKGPGKYNIVF
ncbi:MAG: hypothetical protein HKM05_10335, partial [Spirochaetales bacterium]|nr:hypothetical protein [Spirochaetales bacterium]